MSNIILANSKIISFAALFLVLFLLALYLWQVNIIIGRVYLRDSFLKQIEELKVQTTELSITQSRAESVESVGNRIKELYSFDAVDKVNYIRVLEGVVVRSNEELAP